MRPSSRHLVLAALLTSLLASSAALACMWDYDTLKMERARFPSVLELITGQFLRHSPEFYKWRIQDRLERLKSEPANVSLLDDLSVAYDKIGEHDKAIEIALDIERIQPGRYETAANLGTFYIHGGRPKEGLPHIERALRINPGAHFGREKYQKLLVEYVLHRRPTGAVRLPLADVKAPPPADPKNGMEYYAEITSSFAEFLKPDHPEHITNFEVADALKGILGMMKFGNYDSPILLEALGSLLIQRRYADTPGDAKLLAARAFLKASYETSDDPARSAYRLMGQSALQNKVMTGQSGHVSLEQVEAGFQQELEDAKSWYAELRERELSWIRDGRNPEAEFDRLYTSEPELTGMDVEPKIASNLRLKSLAIGSGVVIGLCLVAFLLLQIFGRRRPKGNNLASM
jgi:tetratricopeptide (TPR) repeat protein